MRAAVLYEANTLLKIEEVSLDPPNDDEVLVRVTATGACHSDYHFMDGTWNGAGFPLPMILGHEAAGTVEQIGARVRTTKPATRHDHVHLPVGRHQRGFDALARGDNARGVITPTAT